MTTRDEFYRQRDLRTKHYVGGLELGTRPVHVHIDSDATCSRSGQLAFLALLNMLARIHRHISVRLDMPEIATLARTPFAGSTLAEVAKNTVNAIDPFASFDICALPPSDAITIGIGSTAAEGLNHYIGCSGSIGRLSAERLSVDRDDSALRGAAVAACLGAAALFRTSMGRFTPERAVSAWNYEEGTAAEPGPLTTEPLEVGRVLMIGAGAVGAALAYWCTALGVEGSWSVLDKDIVALHNTNRGLVFTPRQAGWYGGTPQRKAIVLANLLPGARALTEWYDTCPELRTMEFDVILCLANGRNVRHLVSARSTPVVLQATTGEAWLCQMHRHIAGLDDCPGCRLGDVKPAQFGCSSATVQSAEESVDAALPFLSAASGLMLYTALQQLQAGQLAKRPRNDWRWDIDSPHRMVSSGMRHCRNGCTTVLPPKVRAQIYRGTRWAHLDPAGR